MMVQSFFATLFPKWQELSPPYNHTISITLASAKVAFLDTPYSLRRVHANLFFAHVPLQTQPNPEGRGAGVVCMMHMCFASETWLAWKAHFPISSNQLASII